MSPNRSQKGQFPIFGTHPWTTTSIVCLVLKLVTFCRKVLSSQGVNDQIFFLRQLIYSIFFFSSRTLLSNVNWESFSTYFVWCFFHVLNISARRSLLSLDLYKQTKEIIQQTLKKNVPNSHFLMKFWKYLFYKEKKVFIL